MTGELEPSGDGGELVPPGELRASYADRDRVAEQLRIAAGDGRLTADELDQRLELALTARTYAELTGLTRDLPAVGGIAGPPGSWSASTAGPVMPSGPAGGWCRGGSRSGSGAARPGWTSPKRSSLSRRWRSPPRCAAAH